MASFSVLPGQSVADIGALLHLFQMAEPIPGVLLAYKPATVVKPTKGSKDDRWLVVWWQYSVLGRKVVRRKQGFDLNSIPVSPDHLKDIKSLSISNRVMLIADLDAGKNTRHIARASQEHEGFRYVVLTVKEVENLLSPVLLAKGLKGLFGGERDFDSALLVHADYSSEYIGTYLQTKYGSLSM